MIDIHDDSYLNTNVERAVRSSKVFGCYMADIGYNAAL